MMGKSLAAEAANQRNKIFGQGSGKLVVTVDVLLCWHWSSVIWYKTVIWALLLFCCCFLLTAWAVVTESLCQNFKPASWMFFYQFSLKGHLLCYGLFGIYGSLILSRKLSEPYLKECHCSYLFGLEFKMICFLLDVKSFKCVFPRNIPCYFNFQGYHLLHGS